MKKNLLTLGVLALSLSANAQFISYVGNGATVNVKTGALVYQGGGMKIVGTGVVDNSGNIMMVGDANSKYETVTTGGATKTDGGNFILRMTGETIGSLWYGQLYIKGLSQSNVTGIVDKEYKDSYHGTYQQIALPFHAKTLSTLSTELGKTFLDSRWTQNEILTWNNKLVRMDLVKVGQNTSDVTDANAGRDAKTAYFAIGSKAFVASASKKTLKGVPYTDGITVTMAGAGAGISFGNGGNAVNIYREKYNTYLQDSFDASNEWTGSFGKNIYQYGNPFFTNLDLGQLGKVVPNLQGVRVEPTGVSTNDRGGTTSNGEVKLTYTSSGIAAGDVDKAIIRPMQTFVIKLRDAASQTLNLDDLRRFAYTPRAEGVDYSVTAARANEPRLLGSVYRSSQSTSTVKQLGVIALNQAGEEIGRTYYAVYDNAITGQPRVDDLSIQATTTGDNVIGTFEEMRDGGIDQNVMNTYWLYINEANENNFKGKEIPLGIYSSEVKSLKFEIRENTKLIADAASNLSSGEKFYINLDGKVRSISNGAIMNVNSTDAALYGLYYGTPTNNTTLSVDNSLAKPSNTVLAYDASISNYRIIFDATWKTADVQIYDMAGKLVSSKKKVDANNPFTIELPTAKGAYIVTAVSETGNKFVQKVIK